MKTYQEFLTETEVEPLQENFDSFNHSKGPTSSHPDHAMFLDKNLGSYVHVWGVSSGGEVIVKVNSGDRGQQKKVTGKKAVASYVAYVKSQLGM